MEEIRKSAKTVEDAIAAALAELGATREEVDITVIDEGSKGFLGMFGGKDAVVLVKKNFNPEKEAETFLTIPLVSNPGFSFPGILIPIAAGVTTWLQTKIMNSMNPQNNDPNNPAASMTKTMMYTMPIMMGVFSITMPAGLGLYWTISNIFGIVQQVILTKYYRKKFEQEAAK